MQVKNGNSYKRIDSKSNEKGIEFVPDGNINQAIFNLTLKDELIECSFSPYRRGRNIEKRRTFSKEEFFTKPIQLKFIPMCGRINKSVGVIPQFEGCGLSYPILFDHI